MREFSEFERELIRTKLIDGSGLPTLFSEEFIRDAKIMISYAAKDIVKLQFYSDTLTANQIYDTLVDVVDLLKFLLDNGLVRRHYQPATNMNDFENAIQIAIGDSASQKSVTFLIPEDLHYIAEFIRVNQNSIFRATEPLRTLERNEFLSLEERMHNQNVRLQRTANGITLFIALATIVFTYYQNYQNKMSYEDLNFKVGELTEKSRAANKIPIVQKSFQIQIDSITLKLNRLNRNKMDKAKTNSSKKNQ